MKRMIALLMTLALIVTACAVIPAASVAEALPMYVYTPNGKTVNVRSTPEMTNNVIAQLKYGTKVMVEFINSSGWAVVLYQGREAYIQGRFLQDNPPGPKPTPSPEQKEEEELKLEQEKLNKELKSEREIAEPSYITVRATRTSGWINFRVGPGVASERISSLPDGTQLKAIGETDKWWQAIELNSGKIGYISKNYTVVIGVVVDTPAAAAPAAPVKESLGTLSVNGEFALQCLLPETYVLQVVNVQGSKIVASILSEDVEKPMLYLTIAYNELYSDVPRMNDLSQEELEILEQSFTDMSEVEISYTETAYGTKLMVAREVGRDTDFVDILTVYRGYDIEFLMSPNPEAKSQQLTDAQVQMCVDFLSELDFVSAEDTTSKTESKPVVHHQRIVVGK